MCAVKFCLGERKSALYGALEREDEKGARDIDPGTYYSWWTIIVEEDQLNTLVSSPGAFIQQKYPLWLGWWHVIV